MRRILLCCIFLVSHMGAAVAAGPGVRPSCLDPAGLWCFGTMTMRVNSLIAAGAVFNNGDVLVEVTKDGRTERARYTAGGSKSEYFGLTEDERLPGHIGFKFSMEGFAGPLGALIQAFPGGPASVPTEPVEKTVTSPGKNFTLRAWRLPDDRIAFQLLLPDTGTTRVLAGEFSSVQALPPSAETVASWGPPQHAEPLVRLASPPASGSAAAPAEKAGKAATK